MSSRNLFLPLAVFASIILFFSCNSSQEESDLIDYSSLDELSTEVVLEIGESEDYIPGSLSDVKVTPDGTILAADGGNTTIEQFNSDGEYVGTVAGAGGGPGELSNYFNLHLLNGDTLIARSRSGRKDYFERTDGEKFEHIKTTMQSEHTTRSLEILAPVTADTFYAIKRNMLTMHERLEDPKITKKEAFVVVNENEKVLEDSVQVIKSKGGFAVEPEGGGFIQIDFPFQVNELVVSMDDGNYLVTRPDSSAFFVYNEDHTLERRIPVAVEKRPVNDEDLEYQFDGVPNSVISIVRDRGADQKPPYKKVFTSDNYFWLLTDESEEGKEVIVLGSDGAPVGKFMLSVHDTIYRTEDGRMYTTYRNPEQGYQIREYEIDL